MIAVDQVERLFVEVTPARAEAFATLLRSLVEAALASVIAALRSDTYGRFQAVPAFLALLQEHGATLDLLPPTPTELEDIVTRPVAACHPPLAYESDAQGRSLAEVLVADAHGGDALPLLQMTLQRLFDAEASARRRRAALRRLPGHGRGGDAHRRGGGRRARRRRARGACEPAHRVRARRHHRRGRQPAIAGDRTGRAGGVRARRRRPCGADRRIRCPPPADRRGGRRRGAGAAGARGACCAWCRRRLRSSRRMRRSSACATRSSRWSRNGARAGAAAKGDFLATSPALIAGAAQLSERFGEELPADMRAFIADSLAADARRREAERTRARRIIMSTAAGLVVALCLAGLAGWQWRVASEQRQAAETQRALAEGARQDAQANADKALRNFHASADQAEALIVTLGAGSRSSPG